MYDTEYKVFYAHGRYYELFGKMRNEIILDITKPQHCGPGKSFNIHESYMTKCLSKIGALLKHFILNFEWYGLYPN